MISSGCVSVQCPFGNQIVADIEVEYLSDRRELLDCDICQPVCVGLRIICPNHEPTGDSQYVSFDAKAGLERHFASAVAEACATTWKGKIRDACQQDAERRKLLGA